MHNVMQLGCQASFLAIIAQTLCKDHAELLVDQSFLDNGGDSHTALQLVHAAHKIDIKTSLASILKSPSITLLVSQAELANAFSHESHTSVKQAYQHYARNPQPKAAPSRAQRGRNPVDSYPLTDVQVALLNDFAGNTDINNVLYFRQDLSLDKIESTQHAWTQVISQEQIFQSDFDLRDGCARVYETDARAVLETRAIETDVATFGSTIQEVIRQPSLSLPSATVVRPKVKGILDKVEDVKASLVIHFHHATIDGFGLSLLKTRVKDLMEGQPIFPGPPFSAIARQIYEKQVQFEHVSKSFWTKKADQIARASHEPIIRNQSLPGCLEGGKYHRQSLLLDYTSIDHAARHHRVTYTTMIQAAWALTLIKATGNPIIGFGMVFSGRDAGIDGISHTIGPTMNVLPMYIQTNDDMTVGSFLRTCFDEQIQLLEHQFSLPQYGFSRKLFSAINLLPSGTQDDSGTLMSDFPVHVCVQGCERLFMEVNTELVSQEASRSFKDLFQSSLQALQRKDAKLQELLPSCASKFTDTQMLDMGNFGRLSTSSKIARSNLVDLFTKAANANADATAVERGRQSLTYRQLDVESSKVADIARLTTNPGEVICVDADRSLEWIVAIYGVLKAGCIYCPLDIHTPQTVRADIFEQSGAAIHLSSICNESALSLKNCYKHIAVRDIISAQVPEARYSCRTSSAPRRFPRHANAYLCFTSGSSGKPKGVINTHKGLVAFQEDVEVRLHAGPGQRIAQLMSPAFDGSIHEIFSTLSYGATLVLKTSEHDMDFLNHVDSTIMTPSMAFTLNPVDYSALKYVYFVGEAVSQAVADTWSSHKVVYNMYGPSEAACGATIKRLTFNEPVTLGKPNPSTRVYILNAQHDRLVAAGFAGEICLAGVQVAQGYIGRPEETLKSFKKDPFSSRDTERMYCTGDYGLWDKNGELVILHRKDSQVKINGFRVDLGDIEIRIKSAIPECAAAKVCVNNGELAAFLQPETMSADNIRLVLRERLPRYACPTRISCVPGFPLTRNGKLDVAALYSATTDHGTSHQRIRKLFEHLLADLWVNVLNLDSKSSIKPSSTLVSLGGSSISLILLAKELENAFGFSVPLHTLLASPTFVEMAQTLKKLRQGDRRSKILPVSHPGVLSHTERNWWRHSTHGVLPAPFNVTYACRLPSHVRRLDLQSSIDRVLARHSLFRARYGLNSNGDVCKQLVREPPRTEFGCKFALRRELNRGFDLQREPPIRVLLSNQELLLTISHIVCDLTTLETLLGEIDRFYHHSHVARHSSKTVEVCTEVVKDTNSELLFWERYLSKAPQQTPIKPTIFTTSPKLEGSSLMFKLPSAISREIFDFSKSHDITVHQVLLGAAATSLSQTPQDIDMVFGAPHINRANTKEFHNVGVYVQPLPIRVKYSHDSRQPVTANDFLKHVQISSHDALAHCVPWHKLTSHFGGDGDMLHQPFFDTMVSFHDVRNAQPFIGQETQPRITWTKGNKFRLMIESTALSDDQVLVRMEHSSDHYSIEDLNVIYEAFLASLRAMVVDAALKDLFDDVEIARRGGSTPRRRLDRTGELFGVTWQEVKDIAASE